MKKSELWLIEKGQSEEDLSIDHMDELLKEVESEREKSEKLIEDIYTIQDKVTGIMSEFSEIISELAEIDNENEAISQNIDYRLQELKDLYLSINEMLNKSAKNN